MSVHGRIGLRGTRQRALAKQPDLRYASLADMHLAFRDAAADDLRTGSRVRPARPESGAARLLLDDVLARLAVPGGELLSDGRAAPTASVFNGAAGYAYALLRVARIRGDEVPLGQADLWSVRALRDSPEPDAFWNAEFEIVPEVVGDCSLYHTLSGVQAIASLVAGARGDEPSQQAALQAFIQTVGMPCEHVDVAFGRAGLLLGCALLLEGLPPRGGGWPAADASRSARP